jgi:hypothetical protein
MSVTLLTSASVSSPALSMIERLPLVGIDFSLLEDDIGKSSSNTLDGVDSKAGLSSSVNIRVLESKNINEVLSVGNSQMGLRC